MQEKKIAVLGAGTMGHGIAQVYAMSGHPVSLYSRTQVTLEKAQCHIHGSLEFLAGCGEVADIAKVEARISYTTELAKAVEDAWYVVETVSEKAEVKRALYLQLDEVLPPEVIITSNTSYMNIFEFMPAARQPYSAIVHWIAPPQLIPLVEVVRGPETRDDVVEQMIAFHRSCGKKTIRLEQYVPGFVINRIQSAITQEVSYLVESGLCTKEDIDLAVRTSLMPRGMLLGVVQRMDFGGLDVIANGLENGSFSSAPRVPRPAFIFEPYERGELGVKSGRGLYDYTHQDYATVIRHRDVQLLESVRLAKKFLHDPLHRREEPKENE